jgi:long-chain acyl-CoA synthetase
MVMSDWNLDRGIEWSCLRLSLGLRAPPAKRRVYRPFCFRQPLNIAGRKTIDKPADSTTYSFHVSVVGLHALDRTDIMPFDTIPALFLNAVTTYDKHDAFRQEQDGVFVDVSHRSLLNSVKNAACGLLTLGLAKGDRIGLLSENRIEWVIADLAILCAGCVAVPVYATLPPNQVEFILRDAEVRAVFASGRPQLDKIASVRPLVPSLQHVFSFEPVEPEGAAVALADLLEKGAGVEERVFHERIATIGAGDWSSIIYTSGTTGDPKGAILTHGNIVANVVACTAIFPIGPEDRCLSCLPLSHAFERTAGLYALLHAGVTIVYQRDLADTTANLSKVRPTFLMSVPRLFEKIYGGVLKTASTGSPVRKRLFFWARAAAASRVNEPDRGRPSLKTRIELSIADALVFGKLRRRMGGRIRFFVSGAASLRKDIAEFFIAAGLPILEGYGLTETSPVVAANTFGRLKLGTVGKPVPGVEVRIAEDGEILVRGPNVMQGYFKHPDRTREALREGWFRTGDIGHLDDEGFLVITDRKKDIIVTAGGKNVALQPIEDLLRTSEYISQALLVGDGRRFISAIIVPDFDRLSRFARDLEIPFSDPSDLIAHAAVTAKIREEIDQRSESLAGFQRVKKFVLVDHEFSIERSEVTPTFKLRRGVIEQEFQDEIDALYEE